MVICSSRLASSLTDLYAADVEEDKNTPPSSSSVSLSPSPSPLAPPSLCRYGNGPRSVQHEVNNNSGLYGGSAAHPAGKSSGFVHSGRPGPQDFSPYRGPGPYSALKGPSGRYLSRSIPVSPPTQQQLSPAPLCRLVVSVLTSLTH